jgi:putative phage-type endonuclease
MKPQQQKDTRSALPAKVGLSPKQLELRRTVLGGTDAAAILGLSAWRDQWDVYAEKRGEVRPRGEMSEEARWGLLLEPVILQEYAQRTSQTVRKPQRLYRNRERRWQAGHLDGRTRDRIVEVKVRGRRSGWGEAGSDEIPADIRTQVEHYMAVTGATRVDIAVLFWGQRMEIFTVHAALGYIEELSAEEADWWERHVVRGEVPEWDGSPGGTALLRRQQPIDDGSQMVALPQQYGLIEDFLLARHKVRTWEQQEERLKQALMAAMGPASTLLAPGLKIYYSRSKDGAVVDWKSYASHLEGLIGDAGAGPVWADLPTIRGIYTSPKPGTRTFRVYEKDKQLTGGDA